MAEAITLREAGPHRQRLLEIFVGLDALGDYHSAGAFVVGEQGPSSASGTRRGWTVTAVSPTADDSVGVAPWA